MTLDTYGHLMVARVQEAANALRPARGFSDSMRYYLL
jgi:hypothetical protein